MPSTITQTKRWIVAHSCVPFHALPTTSRCWFLCLKTLSCCNTFQIVPFLVTGLKTLLLCMVRIDPVKPFLKPPVGMIYGLILVAIAFSQTDDWGNNLPLTWNAGKAFSTPGEGSLDEKSYFKVYGSCFWLSVARAARRGAWQGFIGAVELWTLPLQTLV